MGCGTWQQLPGGLTCTWSMEEASPWSSMACHASATAPRRAIPAAPHPHHNGGVGREAPRRCATRVASSLCATRRALHARRAVAARPGLHLCLVCPAVVLFAHTRAAARVRRMRVRPALALALMVPCRARAPCARRPWWRATRCLRARWSLTWSLASMRAATTTTTTTVPTAAACRPRTRRGVPARRMAARARPRCLGSRRGLARRRAARRRAARRRGTTTPCTPRTTTSRTAMVTWPWCPRTWCTCRPWCSSSSRARSSTRRARAAASAGPPPARLAARTRAQQRAGSSAAGHTLTTWRQRAGRRAAAARPSACAWRPHLPCSCLRRQQLRWQRQPLPPLQSGLPPLVPARRRGAAWAHLPPCCPPLWHPCCSPRTGRRAHRPVCCPLPCPP
mmetsp:Transcript_9480/g.23481  ORF Transcript_9480/g.23481 Transcript_9480/m.23481 type:complete len:393 (+) Transcript_9480:248-1426(+)